jgi:hypothetical protein
MARRAGPGIDKGVLKTVPFRRQPTVLYPVITGEPSIEFSEANFRSLEETGDVEIESQVRKALLNIAYGWIAHDQVLQSPRPGKFRKRLAKIRRALERAYADLDLDKLGVTFDRQLYLWLVDFNTDGSSDYFSLLTEIEKGTRFLAEAEASLPADSGRARPKDDHRFIIGLATQFEASGGQARGYRSAHGDDGYGDTPFRRFVHTFYGFLPLESKRAPGGLDEAIRSALKYRRKHTKKSK